jgi:hypothetical protein
VEYTVVITTNSRPYCLERLLLSMSALLTAPSSILVGDSTPATSPEWVTEWYAKVARDFPITVKKLPENCSPSRARSLLIRQVGTKYLLLLDDDLIVTEASNLLLEEGHFSKFDAIGGSWLQWKGSDYTSLQDLEGARVIARNLQTEALGRDLKLAVGFNYTFGSGEGNSRVVLKTALSVAQMRNIVIPVHDMMPCVFSPVRTFKKITFDERFLYFFEWYDFSMQAIQKGLRFGTVTGAHFLHVPEKYASLASGAIHPREVDRERFRNKWGVTALFSGE